ncbi:FAD-dependent thymidylate synthase [Nocardia fluminea]|uniref:FAD-dependent thymidylate synthase n=1 Tax=Nocardia fluminea TaxID=134984 RepID=UPI00365A13DC
MVVFAPLSVELIAETDFVVPASVDYTLNTDAVDNGEELAVFAGRVCYQSFGRPNSGTVTAAGYLANILDHRHLSVLEHATATFYIQGVTRALTHELVRHRHLSPSQVSQRFVDDRNLAFVVPPLYDADQEALADLNRHAEDAISRYRNHVQRYLDRGVDRKRAREAARAFLPEYTETKITLSGNYRAWIEYLLKRDSPHADAEHRRLAAEIGRQLAAKAPNVFGPAARANWVPALSASEQVTKVRESLAGYLSTFSSITMSSESGTGGAWIESPRGAEVLDLHELAHLIVADLRAA